MKHSKVNVLIIFFLREGVSVSSTIKVDNRHCRTDIYNDIENSNKVSNWAKIRHGLPQGSVLGPLLFISFGRSLVRTQLVSLEFFIDIKSFQSHYGL